MKRILAALTLALLGALAVVTGSASALHNDQPNPPHDFTTGGGTIEMTIGITTVEQKFAFSAHDEDANPFTPGGSGHFVIQSTATSPVETSETEIHGHVDCVRVIAHRAVFGGVIEKSSNPVFEGGRVSFIVSDRDQLSNGEAAPDTFNGASECQTSPGGSDVIPITSGNIVVHDDPRG